MENKMNERTKQLLLECKKAGYERVTIFIADKRVPDSVKIEKESTNREYWGFGTREHPHKIVCGSPDVSGDCPGLPTTKQDGTPHTWPAMWGVVKRSSDLRGGAGKLNGHSIKNTSLLDAGYYDLSEIEAA